MATTSTKTNERYIEGVGRRKTATARVRITPASKASLAVNDKTAVDYFKHDSLVQDINSVLAVEGTAVGTYHISAKTHGGGPAAQAEAVRLGIARALVKEDPARRVPLKKAGFLKRDPRAVERKKFGLLKARKRPTWSKR